MAKRSAGPKARRVSRTEAKRLLLERAARVQVPREAEVVVCGGGAAGLAAAITAAEAGAQVVVLERDVEAGRTILATGNGRCNFSNERLDTALYHNASFVRAVTGEAWEDDVCRLFADSGMAWVKEAEGRLYPMSRQAASVRECLLERAGRAGVTFACAREVTGITRKDTSPTATFSDCTGEGRRLQDIDARACILSTGHAPELSGTGLTYHGLRPVLCPIAASDPLLSELDGRRAHARITLLRGTETVACECGEVLLRTYGISGIAAFNLSRHARPGDAIVVDLIPELTPEAAARLATHTLKGILDPMVAEAFERACGSRAAALARAKAWRLEVEGLAETERAQVMRGGLEPAEFCPETLEAYEVPGLFACGEALDVDGPCGGYNLAWAWKSGMVAGSAAAATRAHAQGHLR